MAGSSDGYTPTRTLSGLKEKTFTGHEVARRAVGYILWEARRAGSGQPAQRPGFPKLARLLAEAGYVTSKGHAHWWPAQVQQLLEGRFDRYCALLARTPKRGAAPRAASSL